MYANYFNKYKYTPTKLVAFNSVQVYTQILEWFQLYYMYGYYGNNGVIYLQTVEHCYYQGEVKRDGWSSVAVSTCNGIRYGQRSNC